MNSYLIHYPIDSYRGFIDPILSVTLDNDQLQCLMTQQFIVLRKRLKIYMHHERNITIIQIHVHFDQACSEMISKTYKGKIVVSLSLIHI